MSPRNTTTGRVLEEMILPALKRGGYEVEIQRAIGKRLGGGSHRIDVVASKTGKRFLVSLKWQQQGGTAEQKVPYEVICLADAVINEGFDGAFLVLGGIDHAPGDRKARTKSTPGWKLRNFYIGGGLSSHLVHADKVKILALETFVVRANDGAL
jgi:hypothetical protein